MDPSGGGAVAGPSRPRRVPGPMDLGDRIIAAQRRNASAAGPSRAPTRQPPQIDAYSRGSTQPARRALYDPSRPTPPPRLASPQPPASQLPPAPSSPSRHRDSSDTPRKRPESPSRTPRPIRKLFDPTVHDPHQFSRPPPASPVLNEGNLRGLKDAPSRTTDQGLPVRRSQLPRTAEEEADKERERRRRKEGSERGSGSSGRKKDEAGKSRATRSLGSRSSEGSESFKDRERGKGKGDTGVKAILKDIHDRIKAIEVDLTEMHRKMTADPEAGIAVLLEITRDYPRKLSGEEDLGLWLDLIGKHKQLADLHHDFLTRIFDPLVPPSLHQLTVRYNIPSRLWQNGFHLLLERLRLSWMTGNPSALDLLTDFVYDGYKFYTDLLEDVALVGFRTAWIEALGDLARYRMAIASRLSATLSDNEKGKTREVAHGEQGEEEDDKPLGDGASIGAEVAERWDVEDTDTWRQTARDWYSMGITEKPGEGRLHHHLALLARDSPDGEGRALHHFTRSLMVTHEFPTARESILGLFDLASQRRQERKRSGKGEGVMDLFVRLHGMLFTRIELDKFDEILEALIRKIGEEVGQVDWMIMAAVNIAGMMQYGSSEGVIRKGLAQEGADRRRAQAGSGEQDDGIIEGEEGDAGEEIKAPRLSDGETNGVKGPDPDTWPLPLTCSFRLSFAVLEYTLRYPTIAQGVHLIPNPYLTTFLTFLATLSRQHATAQIILPWIPWTLLVSFLNSHCYGLKPETKLISGVPIPEDWLVRGSEWVGRRVYERGFWKVKPGSNRSSGGMTAQPNQSGERWASETDVLMAHFEGGVDGSQGVVDAVEGEEVDGPVEVGKRRWKRLIWAGGVVLRYIEGLDVRDGEVVIEEPLKGVVEDMERKKTAEKQNEVHSARRTMWEDLEDAEEEGWDGEEDEDLAVLRDRFKHLQSLIPVDKSRSTKTKSSRTSASRLNVVQGYTTLIFDTNVLLNSLSLFSQLVDSGRWTLVVPLPVLTELDGLAKEPPPLGIEAIKAISYLETNVRSKSMTLRIQTTKGSYLSDLRLRTETSTSTGIDGKEMDRKTMDERILDIAKWQLDNFVDRSLMLGGPGPGAGAGAGERGASKAVLVTFDRNLRLRARGMGVEAVDEREMAGIFSK